MPEAIPDPQVPRPAPPWKAQRGARHHPSQQNSPSWHFPGWGSVGISGARLPMSSRGLGKVEQRHREEHAGAGKGPKYLVAVTSL